MHQNDDRYIPRYRLTTEPKIIMDRVRCCECGLVAREDEKAFKSFEEWGDRDYCGGCWVEFEKSAEVQAFYMSREMSCD